MKMSLVIEGLRSDIDAVAELGDEKVAEVAGRIGAVVTRSAPSRILELLSDVAADLSEELPDGRVETRVVGDDVDLAYIDEHRPAPEADADLSARISLRLPDHLKMRLEQAASRDGVSVNGWIVRTLERGVTTSQSRSSRGGKRLHGYGTS
jgi:predicted DNA binding CopG/RHH family protein